MDLDWWLKERTFHHSQFSDVEYLVRLKKEQGIRISLCFPTLNEAKTVGTQIKIIKKSLMGKHHLVDEIGIVDSGSVDNTREIAGRAGAKVFLADEALPELVAYRGKGENLWKSLALFDGDIIIWIDADIRNFHPRFVYGLVGPLLLNQEIGYVKAFYRRPLKMGHKILPGGGRVTELLVRPFLNLLFPDLALLAQPLSGEYAGRRKILEQLPFFTGYGVEMGLLIDIENRFGIRSISQVDMDVRVHRNQSIESLRRMSYVILSVLMRRSEQLGKLALLEGLGHHLQVIKREGADYLCDAEEIHGKERPPILSISSYQEKYGISNEDALLIEADTKKTMMMKCLSHLIDASFVKLELSAIDQKGVIKELLELLQKKHFLKNPDEIIDGLLSREKRLSTNIGHGVAIPHFLTSQLDDIIILMGRSKRGIDFNSTLIRHPVHIVFMILSPPRRRDEYLQSLACIVRLLRHKRVLRDFLHVDTPEGAVALLKKYEALVNLQRQLDLQLLI